MAEPLLLDGKKLAQAREEQLKERVQKIAATTGTTPVLATIIVGGDPASVTYVRMKGNACRRVGIEPLKVELPADIGTADLVGEIERLNDDDRVHGILLQHPIPSHLDEQECFNAISLDKDVDGVNTNTFGRMAMKMPSFKSATPLGIMTILKHYGIEIAGREAVVVGRSPILGKPVAMMLLNENATVTICHSKTADLPAVTRRADILVAAVGRPRFIQAGWVKPGAVLVDAGYNPGNIGDIDLENAKALSSAYTPVPGGVGPMTISCLIEQAVQAAERRCGLG